MAEADPSDAAKTGPLNPGTLLSNRYRIERLIGGGGMGMVYLARDQRLSNRSCAIKEMVDHFIDPAQRLEANEYFAREADTLAQLKHPAVPAITDRFDDQNRHYLVMEYVEGRNLEEELAANGAPLSEGLVIDIARQLCEVLAYLHAFTPPIVYRDMKPSNVMLTPRGRVVLIDFGIARLFKAQRKGTMIGTLGFAPPEQYQGQVDPRSDIYSLGATLHYVLTGRDPEKFPPFSFPKIRDLRPEVTANLARAIDAALAYKVEDRAPTIQDFRDLLLYGKSYTASGGAAVSPKSGTDDLSRTKVIQHLEPAYRIPRETNWLRRVVGLSVFSVVLGAVAFGATYLYSDPALQQQLGVKQLIDQLPWRHEEMLAQAREHPLELQNLGLRLSTRQGDPLSPPKGNFTDAELGSARYLSWNASFANGLAGLEGRTDKIEARFYDPAGLQIASSATDRYVGPGDKTVDFGAVALIPSLADHPKGSYKVALFLDDKRLGEKAFSVTEDTTAKAKEAADREAATKAAEAEAEKQKQEEKRLAMLEERRTNPLQLSNIQFVNSTKSGTPLGGPSDSFNAAKVLFIGWEVTFLNRLYRLDNGQYRVDAAYIAPDGRMLGSVDDIRDVAMNSPSATFSGRVGNSAGNAFLPGTYSVQFFLNGRMIALRKFKVLGDSGLGGTPDFGAATAPPSAAYGGSTLDGPTLATGRINGLAGHDDVPLELRLRPQPNGFLHGEMVIRQSGYGTTGIEGFVRGDHLQFQVPYGSEVLYFEGQRSNQKMTGSFSTTTGSRGTWHATVD